MASKRRWASVRRSANSSACSPYWALRVLQSLRNSSSTKWAKTFVQPLGSQHVTAECCDRHLAIIDHDMGRDGRRIRCGRAMPRQGRPTSPSGRRRPEVADRQMLGVPEEHVDLFVVEELDGAFVASDPYQFVDLADSDAPVISASPTCGKSRHRRARRPRRAPTAAGWLVVARRCPGSSGPSMAECL